jgi:hypothetical protein
MPRPLSRRRFLGTAAAGAGFWTSARLAPAYGYPQNSKLNLAAIAAGGRGGANIDSLKSENFTALCDVYEPSVDRALKKFPEAKKYTDFRRMWDDEKRFDAVVVSTCEHTHAFATLPALKLRKHVYCEKPLTHGVWEARVVAEAALQAKVATQMGTQIHAGENYRRVVEIIQGGVIGKVAEVHVWVGRTWGLQSPEDAKANRDIVSCQERPKEEEDVPKGLNWDLWIGPAPMRPYHSVYYPGPKWYRWWDFGSGTMSDLGSHYNDLPFWALKLRHPLTIQAFGPPAHPEIAPASFRATYEYGPRGDMPACKLTWYQGQEKPPLAEKKAPAWGDGHLFVGTEGMLLSNYGKFMLLPEDKFKGARLPEPTIPRSIGHHAEWVKACKEGTPTTCPFDYSGALTEANHLASIAYRMGKKLEWDPVNLKAKNCPEADKLIKRAYRPGWELKA